MGFTLTAVLAVIVVMAWIVLQIHLTLAGFLNSDDIWNKAQKQAVIDLSNYAMQGDAESLARFRQNYGVLDSDRFGRDAIGSGKFDTAAIDELFRRGNSMPGARQGMVFTLHYFVGAPHIREALAAWRSTDRYINELDTISNQLQRAYAAGDVSAQERLRQRQHIHTVNAMIGPRMALFSTEVIYASTWLAHLLFWSVLTTLLLAALLWTYITRQILGSIRHSGERYRRIFDNSPVAIVMVDKTNERILDVNQTLSLWTGRAADALIGCPFSQLFTQPLQYAEGSLAVNTVLNTDGRMRSVEMRMNMADWGDVPVQQVIIRDISERVALKTERRIASQALGSIVEGVIIVDAEQRIVSTNAAHTNITGFATGELIGRRLDNTRRLPDGKPLPLSIWTQVAAGQNWLGEVISTRKDGSTYPERLSISPIREADQQALYYVAVFSNIFTSKTNQRRLEHLARHDPLTGLVNRDEFERVCGEAIVVAQRELMAVAVLFIDLDGFKFVNDSYSHAIGDRLLIKVAQRLRQQLGEGHVAGRIGGDEFTVLVHSMGLRDDLDPMLNRLLTSLAEPFMIDKQEIVLSASIGVARYPLNGRDPKALIANADAAMYAAKTDERNAFRFYTPRMHADARQRLQLAAELRQALARNEFYLVFQPNVDLLTGQIDAVEALLRWKHPLRNEVMPGEFIPVAESLGLIRRIDEWVLQAACAQIQAWDCAGLPPVRVAVNISARWFGQPAFLAGLKQTLELRKTPARRLLLEITESAMLRLGEDTVSTMHALHAMDIDVAIDDFGTGYSSISYLKLPAVAYLKIDQSFITGLAGDAGDAGDAGIVEAMIAMSKSLGLTTIAEGIETEAQHDFLVRAGCNEGQGYLYSHPVPPAEIERMLGPGPIRMMNKLTLLPPARVCFPVQAAQDANSLADC